MIGILDICRIKRFCHTFAISQGVIRIIAEIGINSYYDQGYTSACVSSSNIIGSGKHESRGDLYQSAQIIGSVVIPEDVTSVMAIAVGTGTTGTGNYYTSVMAEMSFNGYVNIEDTICNAQITAEHLVGKVRAKTHILIQKLTVTPGSTLNVSAQIYYEDACYWTIVKN